MKKYFGQRPEAVKKSGSLPKKIGQYVLGLWFLSLGSALSINTRLGTSPVSVLPYVLSEIFSVKMSLCIIGVYCFYIFIQFLIQGRDFHWYSLTQILFSTAYGYFVDFSRWLIGDFEMPTYWGRLLMLAVDLIVIGLGTALYVDAGLIPMPIDGLALVIGAKTGKSYPLLKTLTGCGSVLISVVISLIFTGNVIGVREGTVITALSVGFLVKQWRKVPKLLGLNRE